MSDSLISVIIPCHNAEQHIKGTVSSVLNQTYQSIEIILVDDGSTDKTGTILDELAAEFPTVHVVHKKNGGVTSARLAGVEAAKGGYITLVDADDRVDADMYERLMRNLVQYNAQISHCGYRLVSEKDIRFFYNTGTLFVQDRQKGIEDLLEGSMIEPSLCNKLFHADLLEQLMQQKLMDISIKNNEDLLMNYYLFSMADKSVFEDFCPYQYIVHEESASKGRMNGHKLLDPVIASGTIYNDLKNDNALSSAALKLYLIKLVQAATFFGNDADTEIVSARKKALKELRRIITAAMKNSRLPTRNKLLALFAASLPHLYWYVHQTFLKMK